MKYIRGFRCYVESEKQLRPKPHNMTAAPEVEKYYVCCVLTLN